MSTAVPHTPRSKPAAAATGVTADQLIEQRVDEARRALWVSELTRTVLAALIGGMAGVLGWLVIDHWVYSPGPVGRFLSLIAFAAWIAWYGYRRLWPVVTSRVTGEYAAWALEQDHPDYRGQLTSYVTLKADGGTRGLHARVVRAIGARAASLLKANDTLPSEATGTFRWWMVAAGTLAILAAYCVGSPKSSLASAKRLALPLATIDPARRVRIDDVQPGNTQALAGRSVSVSAVVDGLRKDELVWCRWVADGLHHESELTLDSESGRHVGSIPLDHAASGVINYSVQAGDAAAGPFQLQGENVPVVAIETVRLEPPAYTKRDARTTSSPAITVIDGTRVVIKASTNRPIERAEIEFNPTQIGDVVRARGGRKAFEVADDGRSLSVAVVFRSAIGRTTTVEPTSYRIRVWDANEQSNPDPIVYPIKIIPDLAPEVAIVVPSKSPVEIPVDAQQVIEVHAMDADFELEQVTLNVQRGISTLAEPVIWKRSPDESGKGNQVAEYRFRPADYQLRAGDVVKITATAVDNRSLPEDPKATANVAATDPIELRIVAGGGDLPDDPVGNDGLSRPDDRPASDVDPQQSESDSNSDPNQDDTSNGGDGTSGSEGDGSSSGGAGGQSQSTEQQADGGSGSGQDAAAESQQQPGGGQQSGGSASEQQEASEGQQDASGGETQQSGSDSQSASQSTDSSSGDAVANSDGGGGESMNDATTSQDSNPPADSDNPSGTDDASAAEGQSEGGKSEGSGQQGSGSQPSDASSESQSADTKQSGAQQSDSQQSEAQQSDSQQSGSQQSGQGGRGESSGGEGDASKTPPKHDGEAFERIKDYIEKQQQKQNQGGDSGGSTAGDENASNSEGGSPDKSAKPSTGDDAGSKGSQGGDAQDPETQSKGTQQGSGDAQSQAQGQDESQAADGGQQSEHGDQDAGGEQSAGGDQGAGGEQGADAGPQDAGGKQSPDVGAPDAGGDQNTGGSEQNSGGDQRSGSGEQDAGGEQASDGQTSGQDASSGDPNRAPKSGDDGSSSNESAENTGGDPSSDGPSTDSPSSRSPASDSKPSQQSGSSTNNSGSGQMPPSEDANATPPPPDMEYTKKATDMVLDYLEETRDQVDEGLLDDLDWSEDDLRRFRERWEKVRELEQPNAPARSGELEDALRSLGLKSPGGTGAAKTAPADSLRNLRDSGNRRRAPAAIRDAFDAFRRRQ